MPSDKLAARDRARQLLQDALDTGVRGDLREAIKVALKLADGQRATTVTDMDYRQLKVGAKLVDPDRPGLIMRHGKRTGRVWIYRYSDPDSGKNTEMQFGTYPDLGLADARTHWAELRDQRKAGKRPQIGGGDSGITMTVGGLVHRYITEYARKTKRSWREDERLLLKHVMLHYENDPVDRLDHEAVAAILDRIHSGGAPREAERVRATLSTMFNVAVGKTRKIATMRGTWLPPDFANPVAHVMLPKREAQSHKPTRAELISYLRGLDELGSIGDILRTQIETMSRIGEVAGMRWTETDLDDRTWTLPAVRSKNGKAHTVMLSRQTADRLAKIKTASTSEYVFPAPTDQTRPTSVYTITQKLSRNRKQLGIPTTFTSHSTRHGALSWVAEHGGTREVRDRLSNHTPPKDGADHIYVAAALNEPARKWTQDWCDHLTALEADNVVELRG